MDQVEIINAILELLYASLGQKVNKAKIKIFFFKNVNYIREVQGLLVIFDLGKYLRILFHHK